MLSLGAFFTKYTIGVMSNLSNHSNGSHTNNSAAEGTVERGRYLNLFLSNVFAMRKSGHKCLRLAFVEFIVTFLDVIVYVLTRCYFVWC